MPRRHGGVGLHDALGAQKDQGTERDAPHADEVCRTTAESCLHTTTPAVPPEIERRCQLFPRDVEHAVMWRQGFFPHEGRDIVLVGVNMRAGIEALFVLQRLPSQRQHVVRRPAAAVDPGQHLAHKAEDSRILRGHGRKDAHPEAVEDGHQRLGGPRSLHLSGSPQGIQPRHADGIARGMVTAHGRCGARDARALQRPRIIARQRLTLDDRDAPHPVSLAKAFRPLGQLPAQHRPVPHLADHVEDAGRVTVGKEPGFHGHGDGGPGLHGIEPGIVAQPVHRRDRIQVRHIKVGAVERDGLVFHPRSQVLTIRAMINIGAGDGAPNLAGMGHLAAAGLLQGLHALPGKAVRAFEPAGPVIARGHGPHLVDDRHQGCRAETGQDGPRHGVLAQSFHIGLAGCAEAGGVFHDGTLVPLQENDGLEPPAAHDGPQTAPGRRP